MKIRNGFVSNSSSSSFVIVGFTIDNKKDVKKFLKENGVDFEQELENEKERIKKKIADGDRWTTERDLELLETEKGKESLILDLLYELGEFFSDFDILSGPDDGLKDDEILVGKMIAEITDEDVLESEEYDFDFDDIKEQAKKFDKKVKIYTGTRMC